jgi:cytidylate kinase
VARLLANRLGALLFDTGALYRAVALTALERGVAADDVAALAEIARGLNVEIAPPSEADGRLYDVRIDGRDVTWAIRSPEVGAIVSEVSEHAAVRAALLPAQRRIAARFPVVMVGRDIGTVVVPDAELKIYLDAAPEVRARRRFRESLARGGTESFDDVLRETLHRDATDSGRATAPLRPAPDSVRIATDDLPVEEVVARIERLVRSRLAAPITSA